MQPHTSPHGAGAGPDAMRILRPTVRHEKWPTHNTPAIGIRRIGPEPDRSPFPGITCRRRCVVRGPPRVAGAAPCVSNTDRGVLDVPVHDNRTVRLYRMRSMSIGTGSRKGYFRRRATMRRCTEAESGTVRSSA